jgi:hypothetical protein
MNALKQSLALAALSVLGIVSTQAQVRITEVDANGSSSAYGADWFELSNVGSTNIDLTGWRMDDNSALFGSAVALRNNGSANPFQLAPGQIAVFLEDGATSANDATLGANFQTAWGANLPSNLTLYYYGGSGVGLGGGGDQVNIYDGTGILMANVAFGASTLGGGTFDNAAGLNNATLTQFSSIGVNGAFTSGNGAEVGSPGLVPEPSSVALFAMGAAIFGIFRRRQK